MSRCNFSKTPSIPLLAKLSRQQPSHPQILANYRPMNSNQKTSALCNGFLQRYRNVVLLSQLKRTRRFYSSSSQIVSTDTRIELPWIASRKAKEEKGARVSSSSWEESADRYFARTDENLVRDSGTKRSKKITNIDSNASSFKDESAEKYLVRDRSRRIFKKAESNYYSSAEDSVHKHFARGGENLMRDKSVGDSKNYVVEQSYDDEEEERDEVGPVDDPRWDKIKSRYAKYTSRASVFYKAEVKQWNKQENWGRKTWKEATASSMSKLVGQGVYGVGPVLAALTVSRREFYALYVQEGMDLSGNNRKKKDKKGVEKVLKLAQKIGLKIVEAPKHDLNMVVDNRPHQGLVLDASPLEMVSLRELEPVSAEDESQRAPLWVALDEVTDPQNLGAIVRSAYFFGADGVVLCAKNSAPLSGVVSKASAGSLELIELRSCKNMMQFLTSSLENGWRVLGGSVASKAVPLSNIKAGVPTILVLGSEGSGLRPLVERSCTELVRIPGSIPMDGLAGGQQAEDVETGQNHSGQELNSFLAVESLNVSVAAGVLLYHLVGNSRPHVNATPTINFS